MTLFINKYKKKPYLIGVKNTIVICNILGALCPTFLVDYKRSRFMIDNTDIDNLVIY